MTPFENSVLMNTFEISKGKTISYKELAAKSGRPKAYRAVGNIMNKNPYPLLIPCHRVVASNHKLGGYAYGTKIKKLLLKMEGARI
ncbi:MAG: MGMT family protein [Candidatus Micrarchaeota archaeon]|nr:MGMT family protein [Candidatus Micrarchaeota archaeon]